MVYKDKFIKHLMVLAIGDGFWFYGFIVTYNMNIAVRLK